MTDDTNNTTIHDSTQPITTHTNPLIDNLTAMLGDGEAPAPTPAAGATILKAIEFPARDYDAEPVARFLSKAFHTELFDDENIVTCVKAPTSTGWWAQSVDEMYKALKTQKPKSLYVSTSTFTPDKADGKLYHRQANFEALHVIVLDDIGTKVSEDTIPADLIPTWKTETSAGNYQWGYALTEPVDNLEAASALVQMIYESGASDDGGKMPNKWVRMPEGINGKKGKDGFVSVLEELNDVTYTPQELIDGLNLNANWEEVLADAAEAMKRRGGVNTGTSPWSPLAGTVPALNGFIDPVIEWLYDEKLVQAHNGGEWFDVVCPNAHLHSDGSKTAGYSPIGYCSEDATVRRFHCFHGSCANEKTPFFLAWVAANGGPEVGMYDIAATLTSQYVFDAVENKVRDIKALDRGMIYAVEAFKNMYPHKAQIETFDGKAKRIPLTTLWQTSKSRVTVHGATFDASTNARLVEQDGLLKANLFASPNWGNGPIDERHITKFMDFITYLIPDAQDRHYFLQTIAAKCQNMSFRGTAMVMIGHQQGLGRSTLGDMLSTLFGISNCSTEELSTIVGDSQFNGWREKAFVIVEEAKAVDGGSRYDAYEKLKTYIDPRAGQNIVINTKHEKTRVVTANTSFLFFSNHTNALAIPEGDRRLYVMVNAIERRSPEFFTELNGWLQERDLDGMPAWGRSVFRWFLKTDVDMIKLLAPPPTTAAKNAMAGMAQSDIDFAINAVIAKWPSVYIASADVVKVLEHPLMQRLEFDRKSRGKFVTALVTKNSTPYGHTCRSPEHPTPLKPRVLNSRLSENLHVPLPNAKGEFDAAALTDAFRTRKVDFDAVASLVNDHLSVNDR